MRNNSSIIINIINYQCVGIRSKWGVLGVITHDVDDCPYVGTGEGVTVSAWDRA